MRLPARVASGQLFEQRVGLAIDDAVPLQDGRPANRLCEVAFAGPHQHEQEAVGHRWHHEKIGRHSLAQRDSARTCATSPMEAGAGAHVFRDRRLADVNPELQ